MKSNSDRIPDSQERILSRINSTATASVTPDSTTFQPVAMRSRSGIFFVLTVLCGIGTAGSSSWYRLEANSDDEVAQALVRVKLADGSSKYQQIEVKDEVGGKITESSITEDAVSVQVVAFSPIHKYCGSFFWALTNDEEHAVDFDAVVATPLDTQDGSSTKNILAFGAILKPAAESQDASREYVYQRDCSSMQTKVK